MNNTMTYRAIELRGRGGLDQLHEVVVPLEPPPARQQSSFPLDWAGGAVAASNLSELELLSGDLTAALAQGREGVELADRSGEAFQRSGKSDR